MRSAVRGVIRAVQPDRIFHLAAQSFVPTSWTAPAATLTNNIVSQVNLFEAIREAQLDPVIHIAGSSEEYGLVYPDEAPIKESNPLRPLSPYAVSKVGQETLAIQYFRSYGMKCIVTRGFNHTGPRRGQVFATSSFAKQIAEIEAGFAGAGASSVGDLDSQRDWTDTRDMVRAYWLATERGDAGRGLQRRPGHVHARRRHARHPAQPYQRPDRQGAGPVAHAPERRAAAVGQRRQVQDGHRLGADDPVRPDHGRPARLLARARARAGFAACRFALAVPSTIQFGTDGWRAVIAETYTFDNVRLAAQACAEYFKASGKAERGIAVGFDTRFGSDRFARAVAEVLAGQRHPGSA